MVEQLDVHLFIWKQEGCCVDLLEKSHSADVTICMSAVKYMYCICRARVIVFNVPCVPGILNLSCDWSARHKLFGRSCM